MYFTVHESSEHSLPSVKGRKQIFIEKKVLSPHCSEGAQGPAVGAPPEKRVGNAVSPGPRQSARFDQIVVAGIDVKAGKGCVDQNYSKLQAMNCSLQSRTRGLSQNANVCCFLCRKRVAPKYCQLNYTM